MGKCCICKTEIDIDTSPILFMGGAGNPRCLCAHCDERIMTATTSAETSDIRDCCRELGEELLRADTNDMRVITTVNELIRTATERADKIDAGEYDFSLDEPTETEGEEFDITEDLEESEEDKLLDEKEERINRITDTVITWVMGIAIVAAVAFFVIKFVL